MIKITTFVIHLFRLYTKNMNKIAKAVVAEQARTRDSLKIAYACVAVLTILVLSQLFTYDEFLPLLTKYNLPGGELTVNLLGAVIVICEVLALPFLLRLKMSKSMRVFSMISGWLVPVLWLFLSLWVNIAITTVSNVGFLGTVVDLLPGWWAVFISLSLGLLVAWASWGLWPGKRK